MQRGWMDTGARNARRKCQRGRQGRPRGARGITEKQAAKARQTERMIQRLDVVEEPRKEWDLRMEIAAAPRSGSVVATLAGDVRRGEFPSAGRPADRLGRPVAITGANGGGKSTLLAALLGRLRWPTDGSLGAGVLVGEIDQARGLFLGDEPLPEPSARRCPTWAEADVRTLLAKFGLKADHVLRPADTLSPGERTRAALALLQARGVNLLVLDEPTNHLDLPAIEQLEQALDTYTGHAAAGHPRPPAAGGGAQHPPVRGGPPAGCTRADRRRRRPPRPSGPGGAGCAVRAWG